MDNQYASDLRNFEQIITPILKEAESKMGQILSTTEQQCFESSKNDVDRFVNCMNKQVTNLELEQKKFDFAMAFTQKSVISCYKNAQGDSNKVKECNTSSKELVQNNIQKLLDSLKK